MKKKLTFTSVFFLLFSFLITAQTETETVFHSVAQKLHEFQYHLPREKVYVHQDRTQYMAGETIWFKVYQSSAADYPVMSGVVYVELINGMNRAIAQTKWKIENGTAAGHIALPDTLTSGVYQLRAYTQWMQNFDAESFFTRDIRIASRYTEWGIETEFAVSGNTLSAALRFADIPQTPLHYKIRLNGELSRAFPLQIDDEGEAHLEIDLPEGTEPEGTHFFIVETPEGDREFPVSLDPPVRLDLFPEGGNLVAGLPSKIAFKVSDRQGKGLDATGVVVDQEGREVRRFQTQNLGHGTFYFEPEEGKQYTARLDHPALKTPLPVIHPKGVVMNMRRLGDGIRIALQHNLSIDAVSQRFYLTIHQEGISWFNAFVDLSQKHTALDIPKEKLPEGIFTITLYDENLLAYCERLAFIHYPEQAAVTMAADKETYGIREKVSVRMEVKDTYGSVPRGDFSVAVVKAGLDDTATRNNFYTDYFLQSELKGRVEAPASYFAQRDTVGLAHLDLLLLTQGWRRYDWDFILSGTTPDISYPVEEELSFWGKVELGKRDKNPEEIELTASFQLDTLHEFISFHPDKNGLFTFSGYDFRDTAEVILSAKDQRNRIMDITIMEHHATPLDYFSYGEGLTKKDNEELYVELLGELSNVSTGGIDEIMHLLPGVSVTAKRKRHKQKMHDDLYAIHTYEVRKEATYGSKIGALGILLYIPHREPRDLANMFLSGGDATKVYFLLDGVRTSAENIKALPPHFIDHVELLTYSTAMRYGSQYVMGEDKFFPIAFWTRDRMSFSEPVRSVTYKFAGYSQPKVFYHPDYSRGVNEYIDPDHRNTVYWQPDVIINEEGVAEINFFSTDDKGEYLIHCEGRTEEGTIGIGSSLIQIK